MSVDKVARTHFLGAIVLERLPVAPGRIVAMNVIDGQQRLTTLQVLLAACWASAKASAATNAEALLKMLLNNTEQLSHAEHPYERYKVWPSLPDRDGFRDVLAAKLPPRAAEEHRLIEARRYFDGGAARLDERGQPPSRPGRRTGHRNPRATRPGRDPA